MFIVCLSLLHIRAEAVVANATYVSKQEASNSKSQHCFYIKAPVSMASVRKRGRISKDDFTGMGHVKWTLDNSWRKKGFNKTLFMGKNYLTLENGYIFLLDPWLLVPQFIEIFDQMEVNGEVLNFG